MYTNPFLGTTVPPGVDVKIEKLEFNSGSKIHERDVRVCVLKAVLLLYHTSQQAPCLGKLTDLETIQDYACCSFLF